MVFVRKRYIDFKNKQVGSVKTVYVHHIVHDYYYKS